MLTHMHKFMLICMYMLLLHAHMNVLTHFSTHAHMQTLTQCKHARTHTHCMHALMHVYFFKEMKALRGRKNWEAKKRKAVKIGKGDCIYYMVRAFTNRGGEMI